MCQDYVRSWLDATADDWLGNPGIANYIGRHMTAICSMYQRRFEDWQRGEQGGTKPKVPDYTQGVNW